jgi:nucleoside-diphosphate-sugar epimerase
MTSIDNLVITGSNGFVGQSLLSYIAGLSIDEQPRKIITLNRADLSKEVLSKYPNLNIEYRITDLALPWAFEISNVYLINLAADGSTNAYSENASKLFTTIGNHCADWIQQNVPVKVFLASSGASYGVVPLAINNEAKENVETLATKETFIKSRLTVENVLTKVAEKENTKIIIGRLFSFVGPNILKKPQYALSSFIHGAIKNKKITVIGNPNTVRSYLHETDMSNWIFRSFQEENPVTILSIGSSIKVRISELAEFIATATGAEVEYLNPNAPGDIYIADNASTLESLGVTETKKWQDAVIECIEIAKELKN